MMTLQELKRNREIVNQIDWTMTPEKAVDVYLEWGAGWTRGNEFARSGDEQSLYFVIYDWERPAQVTLIRRSSKEVEEMAKIPVPVELVKKSLEQFGARAGVGVYALTHDLKLWLSEALDGPAVGPED